MASDHAGVMTLDNEQRRRESRRYWDRAAASFDDEPDHGLRDPVVLSAWTNLLKKWLPSSFAAILDIGCGTGSLSVVLAALGHDVIGIDLSPEMVARAEAKALAAGRPMTFKVMDAADPQLSPKRFDVTVCRHVLWALPEPAQVLQRWADLLAPAGRLLLIEGYWKTHAGMHAGEIVAALPASLTNVLVQDLSDQPDLWGGEVTDERYAVIAERS
jgi:2-polyprenyl-3-methyl-5-hydroxy-6-metoxy-1,4-benzoquinol methylase